MYKRGHVKFLIFALAIIVIGFGFLTSFDYSEPFNTFKLGVNTLSSNSGDFLTGAAIGLQTGDEEVASESSLVVVEEVGIQNDIGFLGGGPTEGQEIDGWNHTFGVQGGSTAEAVVFDLIGNAYVGGYSVNFTGNAASANDYDGHLKKFIADGTEDSNWNITFDSGDGDEGVTSLGVGLNGDIYVGGHSLNASLDSAWMIKKIASTGIEDSTWNKTIENGGAVFDLDVDTTANLVVAAGKSDNGADTDGLVMIYNLSGTYLSNITYDSGDADVFNSVVISGTDLVYVVGYSVNLFGNADGDWVIFSYNVSGAPVQIWNATYDLGGAYSVEDDEPTVQAKSVTIDSFGFVFVVGSSNVTGPSNDWHIKKFDPFGSEASDWNKTFDIGGEDAAHEVVLDSSNNVFVVGSGVPGGPTGGDWHIKKFGADGTEDAINWNITVSGSNNFDEAYSAAVDSTGNLLVVGSIQSNADNWWIKKYGGVTPAGPPPGSNSLDTFTEDFTDAWNTSFFANHTGSNTDLGLSGGSLRINGTLSNVPESRLGLIHTTSTVSNNDFIVSVFINVTNNVLTTNTYYETGITLHNPSKPTSVDTDVICDIANSTSGGYTLYFYNETFMADNSMSASITDLSGNLTLTYNSTSNIYNCSFGDVNLTGPVTGLSPTFNIGLFGASGTDEAGNATSVLDVLFDDWQFTNGSMEHAVVAESGSSVVVRADGFSDNFTYLNSTYYTNSLSGFASPSIVNGQLMMNKTTFADPGYDYLDTVNNASTTSSWNITVWVNLTNTTADAVGSYLIQSGILLYNRTSAGGSLSCEVGYGDGLGLILMNYNATYDAAPLNTPVTRSYGNLTYSYDFATGILNCSLDDGTSVSALSSFFYGELGVGLVSHLSQVGGTSPNGSLTAYFDDFNYSYTVAAEEAVTYCGGAYNSTDTNWIINTSISCSDETIPVTGLITIQDNSETEVSAFGASSNAYYDLRGNSTTIDNSTDLDSSTPTEYTADWDSNANRVFKIVMNESENKVQVFTNISDLADQLYCFDVDDDITTGVDSNLGDLQGTEICVGYYGVVANAGVYCWNLSAPAFVNYAANGTQCNDATSNTGAQNIAVNTTVYYVNDSTSVEAVLVVGGNWIDKKIMTTVVGEGVDGYTTFKNSSLITTGKGNLTLDNVTLGVGNNFTVSGILTVDNSNITINTPNANTEVKFNSGSTTKINHTYIQSNGSYYYSFHVAASDFIMEHGTIDNLCNGCGTESGASGLVMAGTGGTVNNMTLGSNLELEGINVYMGSNTLISNNNVSHTTIRVQGSSGGTNNTITNNFVDTLGTSGDNEVYDNLFSNNVVYTYLNMGYSSSNDTNNTFLNNNLSTAAITDVTNAAFSNYFVYNNSFGEIKWYLGNFTTVGIDNVNLSIGTTVYVENNTLGFLSSASLTNFNTSAQLKFFGLNWSDATAQFCDGNNGNPSNCVTCNSAINCSYSNATGIMLANVSSFSNYTTNGSTTVAAEEAVTYCNGNYTSGDWTINSTISCANETIPVTGLITIQDDSETAVTVFSTSTNAYYDLRGNSTTITNAIPDGDKTTPSEYTADWDSDAYREFYIVMNETSNKLHIYALDNDGGGNVVYAIDVDNNRNTGLSGIDATLDGTEVVLRPNTGVACWNLSAPGILTILNSNGGICDSTFNAGIITNTTVYYNQSGNWTEAVLDIDGSWGGSIYVAESYAGGATFGYTTFKNSSLITAGKGNLTLDNVTLGVGNNFTVNSGGILTVDNSNITMNTPNDAIEFKFNSGSITRINHTYIQSNGSYNYSFYVPASDFILENGNIDNLCQFCGSEAGTEGLIMAGTGGTVNNMTFGSNLESMAIQVYHATNVLISNNNITSGVGASIQVLGSGSTGNTIRNNLVNSLTTSSGAYSNTYSDNIIYSTLGIGLLSSNDANNTFLNNNLSSLAVVADSTNTSVSNYFIYNNSFGEIKWYKSNFTIAGVALEIGTNIYVENNTLGLVGHGAFVNFNTSAQLKFNGLNWTNATAQFCDGNNGNPSNCVTCNSTINCSYASGTGIMLANVTHFSNYTTNGSTTTPAAVDNAPTTTLVSPAASYTNDTAATTEINFSCNATDDSQLVNISLYLTNSNNQSFALNQTTSITGTSNSSSWTLNLSTGDYTWNCLAYDNASQSDWDTNRTILLNYTTPAADNYPYWSTNATSIVTTYSSSTESYFNVTWADETSVSTVYLESNYSGTATNYTMNNITASIYNYSTILPVGTHYWKSYANDSANQINVTDEWTFTIAQASSEVNTTINNSESNLTIDKDTTIDLNCTLITGTGSIYLYNNGSLINSGSSPIGNSTTFSTKGAYNITCLYQSTTNYSASSETYWVTVSNSIPTVTQPAITPATAYTNNTLTANTTYTDVDADSGTVYFLWYVNGTNVYNQTNNSISNGTVVITTLASTYFNKTNAVNLSVYANDGTNDSTTSWSSNTITITNLAPSFDQDLTAQTAYYGTAFTYDVNCSDVDSDTLTYYDNTSLFNIASSTGIITDTPTEGEIGAYTINVSCGDGTINASQTFVYNITDGTAPTVRITAPVAPTSATYTFLNATTNENATCYYKNSTASYAAMSTTGNTTHSQNITGLALGNNLYSVQCNDSYANSATKTKYVLRTAVVANETNTTSLTFVGNSTNTSSILTRLNLTINISASLSNVAISGSEFSSNPEQETFAITSYTVTEFKFYTIDAPELSDYINKITLLFSYNETEVLAAGITEADLSVFYYNTATDLWVAESEVYVDTTANTIEANITHLSTFVLGQATAVPAAEEAAAAAASGSGGGGSAWGLCGDGVCNNGLTCSNCPEDCGVCPVEEVVEETTEEVTEETKEVVTETTAPEIKDDKLPLFGSAIAFAGDFKEFFIANSLSFYISGGVLLLLIIIFIVGKVIPKRKVIIIKKSSSKPDSLLLKKPSKETSRIEATRLKRYKRVTEDPNKKKQSNSNKRKVVKKKHIKKKHIHKVKHKKK